MSSSPKPPKPTDPNEAAAAQARWNRFSTQGPGGGTTWTGEGPDAVQTTTWSPELQGLFGQMQGIAGADRQQYAAPEGFAQFRDGLVSRLNDRQQMGRPVYQPTQTIGGTLGPNSQANGPALGGPSQAMPDDPPMTIQPVQEPGGFGQPGGPQLGIQGIGPGGNKPPTDLTGYTTGGKPSVPFIGGGGVGGGPGGAGGGSADGQFTQPVPPGGKSLAGTIGGMLGGQPTETPWRDAFLGPKDPATGDRDTMRNLLRGGAVGALGRGFGNMLANRGARADAGLPETMVDAKPMGQASLDRQLGEIGRRVQQNAANLGKPQKPGSMPRGARSTRAASGFRLGAGREGMNALRDMAALAAMGIGRNDDMER